jgi:hypothetical protein
MDVAKLKRLPFLVGYQRRMDRNFRSLKKQARRRGAVLRSDGQHALLFVRCM